MQTSFSSAQPWNTEDSFETIRKVSERLKNTVIFARDYGSVLTDFGDERTLAYLDPPYAVTVESDYYEYQMTEQEHEILRDTLIGVKCKFVLSYDIHPLVDKLYSGVKLFRMYKTSQMFQSSSNKRKNIIQDAPGRVKSEYLITNFDIQSSLPLFSQT